MVQGDEDRLIGLIHGSVFTSPIDRFKEGGLHALREVIPFNAAVWATGEADSERIYSIATVDYPLDKLVEYAERWQTQDIVRAAAAAMPGQAFRNEDVMPRAEYCASSIYRQYSRPAGIEHALGIVSLDPITRVGEMLFLFRSDPDAFYSDQECRTLERLLPHFTDSWQHRELLHVYERYRRPPPATVGGKRIAHAVISQDGHIHTAEPTFGLMLREAAPGWTGPLLPAPLRAALSGGQPVIQFETLRFAMHRGIDRVVLAVTPQGDAPALTAAERRVAIGYARGLSASQLSAELGVRPRTVRNQLAAVYRKLDVHDRLSLIDRLALEPTA